MTDDFNVLICNVPAYVAYQGRDLAGSLRVRNIFDVLARRPGVTISNLVPLDRLEIEHDCDRRSLRRGIDCLSIGYENFRSFTSFIHFIWLGLRFIDRHRVKDQVNFFYHYEWPSVRNFIFIIYAKLLGFQVIFDIVENDVFSGKSFSLKDPIRGPLSRAVREAIGRYADFIFAISTSLASELTARTRGRVPVELLPISVDVSRITEDAVPRPARVSGAEGLVTVFYGGTFEAKDCIKEVIRAVQVAHASGVSLRLVLSGNGHSEIMEFVTSEAQKCPFIEYRGLLSVEDYFKALSGADICCAIRSDSPAARASFPFKLGEFLAAGKVVVASRTGDVGLYLSHLENAYLVRPSDASEIAEALRYCVANIDALKATLGPAARSTALEFFDAEKAGAAVYSALEWLHFARKSRPGRRWQRRDRSTAHW